MNSAVQKKNRRGSSGGMISSADVQRDSQLKPAMHSVPKASQSPVSLETARRTAEEQASFLLNSEEFRRHIDLDHLIEQMRRLLAGAQVRPRVRIMVRHGVDHVSLPIADIVFFYSEYKTVYAMEKSGKKFMMDTKLVHLEAELDKRFFFRTNRKYIVHLDYIKSFRAYERVKLRVELAMRLPEHFITVSQEKAPLFKKWMAEA